jgi:hypothetical protein
MVQARQEEVDLKIIDGWVASIEILGRCWRASASAHKDHASDRSLNSRSAFGRQVYVV